MFVHYEQGHYWHHKEHYLDRLPGIHCLPRYSRIRDVVQRKYQEAFLHIACYNETTVQEINVAMHKRDSRILCKEPDLWLLFAIPETL